MSPERRTNTGTHRIVLLHILIDRLLDDSYSFLLDQQEALFFSESDLRPGSSSWTLL
jgi:hypothetical protein